ncbi:hypothetical protein P7C73_g6735, partial [Tremellales sp. Uapishka_1]
MLSLASSPPVLPIPRQPSPLSFSIEPEEHTPPPPPVAKATPPPPSVPIRHGSLMPVPPVRQAASVPLELLPDSLLLRSTFSAMEHSAGTLKRLSKSVLTSTSAVLALMEQLEKAEDEFFTHLGELGRWLEGGYGLHGTIWEDDGGIRKVRAERRRREKDEMENMVEHGLQAVKAELKRQGLAGGGAQAKFEQTAKQYYQQTSAYLAPQSASTFSPPNNVQSAAGPSTVVSTSATPKSAAALDAAQATRIAQFNLARYNHHSTLLYTVPPTSLGCLDLLVGLYGWAGGILGETPRSRPNTEATDSRTPAISATTSSASARLSPVDEMKSTLTTSLTQLSQTRAELLQSWALRNAHNIRLEELASSTPSDDTESGRCSPRFQTEFQTPVGSNGIEHKGKMKHRIQRSVGGRLRDFLSNSPSSTSLTNMNNDRGTSSPTSSRMSLDGYQRPYTSRVMDPTFSSPTPIPDRSPYVNLGRDSPSPLISRGVPFPISSSTISRRPSLPARHSTTIPQGQYVSPFLPFESSPNLSLDTVNEKFGGVGGINGTGDEDEQREEVGRKKEGVLWG